MARPASVVRTPPAPPDLKDKIASWSNAELFQALNDVGFTIPANAMTYWVEEAMGSLNFVNLEETPDVVRSTLDLVAHNTVHAARLFKAQPYPGEEG